MKKFFSRRSKSEPAVTQSDDKVQVSITMQMESVQDSEESSVVSTNASERQKWFVVISGGTDNVFTIREAKEDSPFFEPQISVTKIEREDIKFSDIPRAHFFSEEETAYEYATSNFSFDGAFRLFQIVLPKDKTPEYFKENNIMEFVSNIRKYVRDNTSENKYPDLENGTIEFVRPSPSPYSERYSPK